MPRGRPQQYATSNDRVKAFRERERVKKAEAERLKLEALKHEQSLQLEARAMAAKLLRDWIKSADAERFVSERGGALENHEDRIKIIRYIVSEATRMENTR